MMSLQRAIIALVASLGLQAGGVQRLVGHPEGAISGEVHDGYSDRPIADAVVYLSSAEGARSVLTDAKGRFVFVQLSPGNYSVAVTKPGYVRGYYGSVPSMSFRGVIELGPAEWFDGARVNLSRTGAIGGAVTDEFGELVAGAPIRLLTSVSHRGRRILAAGPATTTDDRGQYRIAGLSAGAYWVLLPSIQFTAPPAPNAFAGAVPRGTLVSSQRGEWVLTDYLPPVSTRLSGGASVYPTTFYPSARQFEDAIQVKVTEGEERSGVDLTIRPERGFRVQGRVAGGTAGTEVRLVLPGLEQIGRGGEVAVASLGSDGSFMFFGVPPGRYAVVADEGRFEYRWRPEVQGPNYELPSLPVKSSTVLAGPVYNGPAYLAQMRSAGPSQTGIRAFRELLVASADVADVEVPAMATSSISGVIRCEAGCRWSGGSLLFVQADSIDGSPAASGYSVRVTWQAGDTGRFSFANLPPATYSIRLLGVNGHCAPAVSVDGRESWLVQVEPGARRDIAIVVSPQAGRAAGVVASTQGEPIAGGLVLALPTAAQCWNLSCARSAVTSSKGHYQIGGLRPGPYYLVALDGARAETLHEMDSLAPLLRDGARIEVPAGGSVSSDLRIRPVAGGG